MDVHIVNQPDLRIAGIRHIGPYQEIGREFGRLGGLLKGPPPAGSQMIALFHDDPAVTPPDKLRSDAALTLPGNAPVAVGADRAAHSRRPLRENDSQGRIRRAAGDVGGVEELTGCRRAATRWAIRATRSTSTTR